MAISSKSKYPDKSIAITIQITTILIIALSVISVISIFLINDVQNKVQSNLKTADKWNSMVQVVEKDIDKILDEDSQKQQMALYLQQDFLYLNDLIKEYKIFNATVKPGSYNQSDIDFLIIQATSELDLLNSYIRDSYAYNWTAINGGNSTNNYMYMYIENYLIVNNYGLYNSTLDPDLLDWLNTTYFPNTPEMLQIDLFNWESELFWNASIVFQYSEFSKYYANILGINLEVTSYYEMQFITTDYEWLADSYSQCAKTLTSALLLLTISAVILAYVVSISGKYYIWVSLTLGIIVSIIGIYMFYSGVMSLIELVQMPLF
ncbi:MAG: hypothetical protein ACTSRS_16840 [Candidatus Helarchaeota archaeon]